MPLRYVGILPLHYTALQSIDLDLNLHKLYVFSVILEQSFLEVYS